jgi:hypothetical protein
VVVEALELAAMAAMAVMVEAAEAAQGSGVDKESQSLGKLLDLSLSKQFGFSHLNPATAGCIHFRPNQTPKNCES